MNVLRRALPKCHASLPKSAEAPRRALHLAPPFLLDDYVPRYMTLSSIDESKKRSKAYAHLSNCNLCPRLCGVNRFKKTGVCLIGDNTKVNVIAPHFEPCVQGHNGSGAVFFSGCNLRCVFCQNHDISHQRNGQDLTPEELGEWYVKLQQVGRVHNINLITPEHVTPQVVLSILHARELGLRVPIIYNTSPFDSLASLELLDGLVDIYLPDFKVWEASTSKRLLKADDYAATARESIKAMHRQVGDLCFTGDGIAKKGLLVRHLVMPGKEEEGRQIMRFLAEEVSRDCFVNILEQYHPDAHVGKSKRRKEDSGDSQGDQVRYGEINRAVSDKEISLAIFAMDQHANEVVLSPRIMHSFESSTTRAEDAPPRGDHPRYRKGSMAMFQGEPTTPYTPTPKRGQMTGGGNISVNTNVSVNTKVKPVWTVFTSPGSFEQLYTERAYLGASLRNQGQRSMELMRRLFALQEKIDRGLVPDERRKSRKKAALIKSRITEATAQEKAMMLRLGDIDQELHIRERWMQVQHEMSERNHYLWSPDSPMTACLVSPLDVAAVGSTPIDLASQLFCPIGYYPVYESPDMVPSYGDPGVYPADASFPPKLSVDIDMNDAKEVDDLGNHGLKFFYDGRGLQPRASDEKENVSGEISKKPRRRMSLPALMCLWPGQQE
ncbi:Uncharacterized protein C8035_v012439 [Colletotrichum spinosum]|uniref:Radical SAM core domain-containing protein n=1 Tax=Colletotrichum spinosum TaxID=1347390 RepID=A0A4R8Q1X9_9PEZI|nr:Uncharacterized protein C8035_v012439 [Colletotrichum spinosum]